MSLPDQIETDRLRGQARVEVIAAMDELRELLTDSETSSEPRWRVAIRYTGAAPLESSHDEGGSDG